MSASDLELQEHRIFADYLDGQSAIVHRVGVDLCKLGSGWELTLSLPNSSELHWPLDGVRVTPDQAGSTAWTLAHENDPLARLCLKDVDLWNELRTRCRSLNRRPPIRGRGRIAAWALAAVASVALIVFVLVPVMADQLAEFLPPEGEKALGDATFEQIRTALAHSDFDPVRICNDPSGVEALTRMRQRLEEGTDLPYELTVNVLDHEMVNAFALPGGRVVFFRGLLDAAETPDEIAAVFAHEIGHVANRDPARGALRSAGSIGVLGLLLGDFAGGAAVLLLVERLIDAQYSQEAEAGADRYAHSILAEGGMTPAALAKFFERLRTRYGDTDGIVAHLMAHPRLGDRIAAARTAADSMSGPIRPSLGEQDWQALKGICRSTSG